MGRLTKSQRMKVRRLREEKAMAEIMHEYSIQRLQELTRKGAPDWMLERYHDDIKAYRLRAYELECELDELHDAQCASVYVYDPDEEVQ